MVHRGQTPCCQPLEAYRCFDTPTHKHTHAMSGKRKVDSMPAICGLTGGVCVYLWLIYKFIAIAESVTPCYPVWQGVGILWSRLLTWISFYGWILLFVGCRLCWCVKVRMGVCWENYIEDLAKTDFRGGFHKIYITRLLTPEPRPLPRPRLDSPRKSEPSELYICKEIENVKKCLGLVLLVN